MAAEFEIRKSSTGQFYWRFQGRNNEILCHSEMMTSKAAVLNGIKAVKDDAPGAPTNDKT